MTKHPFWCLPEWLWWKIKENTALYMNFLLQLCNPRSLNLIRDRINHKNSIPGGLLWLAVLSTLQMNSGIFIPARHCQVGREQASPLGPSFTKSQLRLGSPLVSQTDFCEPDSISNIMLLSGVPYIGLHMFMVKSQ